MDAVFIFENADLWMFHIPESSIWGYCYCKYEIFYISYLYLLKRSTYFDLPEKRYDDEIQLLTCLTIIPTVSCSTCTRVVVNSIRTCSSILTEIGFTFIYV